MSRATTWPTAAADPFFLSLFRASAGCLSWKKEAAWTYSPWPSSKNGNNRRCRVAFHDPILCFLFFRAMRLTSVLPLPCSTEPARIYTAVYTAATVLVSSSASVLCVCCGRRFSCPDAPPISAKCLLPPCRCFLLYNTVVFVRCRRATPFLAACALRRSGGRYGCGCFDEAPYERVIAFLSKGKKAKHGRNE